MASPEDFPRQLALTRRFSVGVPRNFTVSPDGRRVLFLRSGVDPTDPLALWSFELLRGEAEGVGAGGQVEYCLADPSVLLSSSPGAGDGEGTPEAELARRERARESSPGIVDFSLDRSGERVAFALAGRLWALEVRAVPATSSTSPVPVPSAREIPSVGGVVDPQLSPDGQRVAYVSGGRLRIVAWDGTAERALSPEEPADMPVTWGLADFAAAEEFGRSRGHWWSPDSDALVVERVDESPVPATFIADPSLPSAKPREQHYPLAGGPNVESTLWLLRLDGTATEALWDRNNYPYLVRVCWSATGPLLLVVMSRDQRRSAVLEADAVTGATTLRRQVSDPHWVDAVPGSPSFDTEGHLLSVEVVQGHHRLLVEGRVVSPDGVEVRAVRAEGRPVLVETTGPRSERHVWRLEGEEMTRLSSTAGVHRGYAGGETVVISSSRLESARAEHQVIAGNRPAGWIESLAEAPVVRPRPEIFEVDGVATALLLPSWHRHRRGRLPVLMDPYGGPSATRVLRSSLSFLISQWFAEMGFAVIVADGRGTPGSPAWERSIAADLAGPVLDDQVKVLQSLLASRDDLDPGRVGIRGWSFGGFLAALAVLRRPELFHAAVAGAPPTDWRLYDTAYTERYLGIDPEGVDAAAYENSSLLPLAGTLTRPLLLVHGLADDNVLAAHSLRLSQALLEAGRPHSFLPLSGVTHMASQTKVSENLLRVELDFFRHHLGVGSAPTGRL